MRRRDDLAWVSADVDDAALSRYASRDKREELTQRKALSLPSIFVSANNIAKAAAAYMPEIVMSSGPDEEATPIKGHEFEALLQDPNDWMSSTYLLWFTFMALPVRGEAFLYMADDMQGGSMQEIWPIPPMKMTPVPSQDTSIFISHYNYEVERGAEPIRLPPENVLWVRQPNIFDLFSGMSSVASLATNIETSDNQRKFRANFFGPMNARPSVLFGIRKDVSKPVFEVLKEEILRELQAVNRAAMVHRAGDIDVQSFGMTVEDLSIVQLDDADARVFKEVFGWSEALGARQTTYASAYAAEDLVNAYTIWPYLKLFAGDLTAQVIKPRYGDTFRCRYKDIRLGRKDVERADYQVYSVDRTINENRDVKGLKPITGEHAEVCDTIPVRLLPYVMGEGEEEAVPEEGTEVPDEIKSELDKWQRKALRWLKEGRPPTFPFESSVLTDEFHDAIIDCLYLCETVDDVKGVFAKAKGLNGKPRQFVEEKRYVRERRISISGEDDPLAQQKDDLEAACESALLAFWKNQLERIGKTIESKIPKELKANLWDELPEWIRQSLDAEFWANEDRELIAVIVQQLVNGSDAAIQYHADQIDDLLISIGIDWELIDTERVNWAREHAGELCRATKLNPKTNKYEFTRDQKTINGNTRKAIGTRVAKWFETPGATLGDLMEDISQLRAFGPQAPDVPGKQTRAQLVATTEITRSVAYGNKIVADHLSEQLSPMGITAQDKWNTNRDDKVCFICRPLHAKRVNHGDPFGEHPKTKAKIYLPVDDTHPGCFCWITTKYHAN
jgi:hypothetical protein